MTTGSVGGNGRRVLGVALVVGLIVRAAIFLNTGALTTKIVDEQHYAQLATNIVQGNGFAMTVGQPTSIRPPLYPALVAAIWSVTGVGNLQAIRFVQILLSLVTTWLVYQIGRRAFNNVAVGEYAAALFWLSPSFIYFDFLILTETLFTLLLLTFVLLSVMLVQPGAATRNRLAIACGLALGVSALARSVLWPLPVVVCPLLALMIVGTWRRKLTLAALVFVGYAAAVTPWAIRNTRLQGVVEIVDTMGGLNLRMGNYEYTPDDRMWDAVGLTGTKSWIYAFTQEHPGETPTEGQKDKWAQAKALVYIRANPVTTLRRDAIKFADFWGLEREFVAGVKEGLFSPPAWFAVLATLAIALAYPIVAVLGAAGAWLAAPRWRSHVMLLLPIVAIAGVHTIVFGHSRYHVPLEPLLMLYAVALIDMPRPTTWANRRPLLAGAAVTIAILVAIWMREVLIVDAARIRALFG